MKFILLLLLFFNSVFAVDLDKANTPVINIWSNLTQLEKNYTLLLYPSSKNNPEEIDKILLKNEELFSSIYKEINKKEKIDTTINNQFFNEMENQKAINFLNRRIDNNGRLNSTLPIYRDTFDLLKRDIKSKIYKFILFLDTNPKKEEIIDYINKEKLWLSDNDYNNFNAILKEDILNGIMTKQKQKAYTLFKEFKVDFILFEDFLKYIALENKINFGEKIIKDLYINEYIDLINNNKHINLNGVNSFLSNYNLDVGRIIVTFVVLIFFIILGIFFNKGILYLISKKYSNKDIEHNELYHENSLKMKAPLLAIMSVTSIHVSLLVLFYNKEFSDTVYLILNTFYILSFYWFLLTFVSSTFSILLHSNKYRQKMSMRKELVNLGLSSIKVLITLVAFIVLLHYWGVNISGILTGLGLSGMVIAFAAKDLLSNFFGTVKIIMDDSFSQGDWIEVNGVEGTVSSLSFGNTKIRTFENGLITIPNSVLASSPILNWNKRKYGRQIKTTFGLTYNSKRSDINNAINEINEMLENHPDISTPRKHFEDLPTEKKDKLISIEDTYGIKRTLFVKLVGFSDSSVDILLYAYTKTVNWGEFMDIRQEVYMKIWEIFEKNNLDFAFPTRTLHIEKN